ncbi:MAG TPA: hypothetical protein VF547_10545 [Allosphingosinicella sp.]|jgi:hypothetical protein
MGLTGCGFAGGATEVRYKVTVEVLENGSVRSGSSVWSWRLSEPTVALASPYDGKLRGEAVAVELGNGRTLFAVLRGTDGESGMAEMLPERLFGDVGRSARGERTRFSPDRIADLRDIASRVGETATVPCAERPGWCPMLVTFRNISDPTSVEQVDPTDIAATLGPGYALKAITVELVSQRPEHAIEARLPWLAAVGRERASLIPNPPRLLKDTKPIQLVAPSDFSTELYR